LAACLIHASRAVAVRRQRQTREYKQGTCPELKDSPPKGGVNLDSLCIVQKSEYQNPKSETNSN